MPRLLACATIFLFTIAGTGCSLTPVRPAPEPRGSVAAPAERVDLADAKTVRDKLYLQYRQWKGTTYAYGGLSKNGIDCSGFVYLTYLERLGIELPRSTELLAQTGKVIKRSDLRAGDLVFFKTGFKGRHVGIYLEKGKFLHVSTKRGVIISGLGDDYWKDRYWQARRVGL